MLYNFLFSRLSYFENQLFVDFKVYQKQLREKKILNWLNKGGIFEKRGFENSYSIDKNFGKYWWHFP